METALERIAAIASTLKEAELRTLLELTHRAAGDKQATRSSRQLAEATGLSRKNVQLALDSLAERGLIQSDGGSATRAAAYKLSYLEVEVLPGRGVITTPPPPEQVALFQRHPGAVPTPPLASEERHTGVATTPPPNTERAMRARESIEIEFEKAIDRLRRANPAKYDPNELAEARRWIHGYMAKFGDMPDPHPPDDLLLAQFLAVAEWPRLLGMLQDLMAERRQPKISYGWFVTVALQRIWGITPQRLKEERARLKLVRNPQPVENQRMDGQQMITELAARKAMR